MACGEREHDLVERLVVQQLLDRGHRLMPSGQVPAHRPVGDILDRREHAQQVAFGLRNRRSPLGVQGMPLRRRGVGDEDVEIGGPGGRPLANCVQQRCAGLGTVGDDEDASAWQGRRIRSQARLDRMSRTYELAGVEVPRIGLGTNRLTDDADGVAFIRAAIEAGVRHIDTAHLYTGGASERAIGAALGGARDDVVVATKGGYRPGEGQPDVLDAQIAQSLEALRTDVIDLYYLHRIDPETPLEESLGALKAHVDRGTIRAAGISDATVEQIERARRVLPIAAVQNEYNAEHRDHDDVVDHCETEGIAFVAYYPLHGSGGSNAEKLRALLDRSPCLLPIPGTRSIEHLRENLAALDA